MTVVVVGGSSGIGLAIAGGFADAGRDVVAVGLELPDSYADRKTRLSFQVCDVTDRNQVAELMDQLDAIEVLVNAAGIIRRDDEFEPDIFSEVLNVNLVGLMQICVAAHSKLAATNGSIINIASMLSQFGGARVPAYSASKGGVVQLTKSLAIAWAADGIRVNALAPGWIATPLTEELRNSDVQSRAILDRTPLARWGNPEDLVGPALFLASPGASFITGAVLHVDGGYSIM